MPKRETAAASSKRQVSEAQRAAGRANLAKGRAAKAERDRHADPNAPRAKDKWAKLIAGEITVADMDDEELKYGQFRNKHGNFGGKRRKVPGNIARQISDERMRRFKKQFMELQPLANEVFERVMAGDYADTKVADQIKAAHIVTERNMGKPDTKVTVNVDQSVWDNMNVILEVDRDLPDKAS